MENSGTQLQLDFGVLTAVQQETVDRFVKSQNTHVNVLKSEKGKLQSLLIQGGFQEGVDFINDVSIERVTETRTFGYGDDKFTAEVTYDRVVGDVKIISDYYNGGSNRLEVKKLFFSRNDDKLECFTITGTFRAYKPSTLLSKLNSYNEGQKDKFERANKQKIVLNHTIEKYKTMYPDADVKAGTDYKRQTKGYSSFPIVTVKFKSGSYIAFRLGREVDQEFIHKKFNAVANNMSVTEVLEMFNNQ